jgi:hypothetical protein
MVYLGAAGEARQGVGGRSGRRRVAGISWRGSVSAVLFGSAGTAPLATHRRSDMAGKARARGSVAHRPATQAASEGRIVVGPVSVGLGRQGAGGRTGLTTACVAGKSWLPRRRNSRCGRLGSARVG